MPKHDTPREHSQRPLYVIESSVYPDVWSVRQSYEMNAALHEIAARRKAYPELQHRMRVA